MPTLPSASLKLDAEIESRLLRLAETRQQSADLLVREAIGQYVEREECRERLREDARAAWGGTIRRPGHASRETKLTRGSLGWKPARMWNRRRPTPDQ